MRGTLRLRYAAPSIGTPHAIVHAVQAPRDCLFASAVALCVAAAALTSISGCSHATFTDRIYQDRDTAYRVGWLPQSWKHVRIKDGDIAYTHPEGGTIYADHFCRGPNDAPLDVLINHLLFDVRKVHEISRKGMTLDGREALRTQLEAEVDGVPVALDMVVLRKDGCTYDMVLISGPSTFADRVPDFDIFVHGFTTVG